MKRRKVLIVEDERAIATLLQQVIRGLDVEVDLAHDGLEALTKIRQDRPDMVLLDLIMPVMSGEELLTVMQTEGLLPGLPVIVISTQERAGVVERLGLQCIAKPFEARVVKRLVREQLGLD